MSPDDENIDADLREPVEKAQSNADDLQKRSDELEGKIDEARKDWERKREDPAVPGAPAPVSDDESDA